MSNKNPFELRFDTLQVARDMLDREYDTAQTKLFEMLEHAKVQQKDLDEVFARYTPKMYSPQDIMEKAEQLYKFVTTKS